MTTRGIRRKKSSVSEIKIAVVGAPSVGKSALIVRFKTKRYIGEYDHHTENRYKHEIVLEGDSVVFEILDTCSKETEEFPNAADLLQWADGFLLVYSITDRNSFNYIRKARAYFHPDTTVGLVANKADLVHLRQVSTEEGEILAKDFDCKFNEVSAAEHVGKVSEVFLDLCKEILCSKRKSKQSLLERMLGGTRPYSRGKSDSAIPKD